MDAATMFGKLFGDAVDETRQLVIWTRQDKTSRWHTDIERAAADVKRLSDSGLDVYFGCALQDPVAAMEEARRRANEAKMAPPMSLTHVRGSAASARAIGGIWLDVDVIGPGHKKPGLPVSIEEAIRGVNTMPMKPTMILNTGGGIHAWWMFREPWLLETAADRARATRRVYGWQAAARLLIDWPSLDSTHDLARVLRPAGTKNYKVPSSPRDVVVSAQDGLSVNPSDFELWEQEARTEPAKLALPNIGARGPVGELPPVPPAVTALSLTDVRFYATWERERRDLDGSASAYDMSIAIQLAKIGCDAQTIADAILAWRTKHNEDIRKALRSDYLALTIGKAMQRVEHARQDAGGALDISGLPINEATAEQEAIEGTNRFTEAVSVSVARGQMPAPQVVAALLRDLNDLLPEGAKIVAFSKVGTAPEAVYFAQFAGDDRSRKTRIGGASTLMAPGAFRAFIMQARDKLMPPLEQKKWDPILRGILASMEIGEVAPDLTAEATVRHVVETYLESVRHDLQAQLADRDRVNGPTRAQGRPTVYSRRGESMRAAVTARGIQTEMRRRGVRVAGAETLPEIAAALLGMGFERKNLQYVLRGQHKREWYFLAPQALSASLLGEAGGYEPTPDSDLQPEDEG